MQNKKDNENLIDENEDVVFEEDTEEVSIKNSIKKLRDKLSDCEKQKQEYLNNWQREKAEFINIRKRDEEAQKEFIKFSKSDIISQFIPVLDSFESGFSNKEAWEKAPIEWRQGVESIHEQILGVLKANGLEEMNPLNETFDPSLYESVGIEKSSKEDDHKILKVVQKGYGFFGKVLRSAKVIIGEYNE